MIDAVRKYVRDDAFRRRLVEILIDICRIDTTPSPDVSRMRDAESAVFDILERELNALPLPGGRCERRPIDPAIAGHPAFSKLHFTRTPERPEGLSPEETYAGRANLLYLAGPQEAAAGPGPALNAHIDVVAPYFPPRLEGSVLYGRGACDDKGNVVAMLGALKAAAHVLAEQNVPLPVPLTAMIVVEEETGGNGSLSLALDRELKQRYDSMMVLECCDNRIHPANRGAVWYEFDIAARARGINDVELAAFLIEELENEGRAIRAESRHDLFPQRPVQTCQGILDRYGEHPSRICGLVAFELCFDAEIPEATRQLVRDVLDFAVTEYTGLYGDKTKGKDPVTGAPKVARHYDVEEQTDRIVVRVNGSTGHMGSILENDDAITKAAWMIRNLVRSNERIRKSAGCGFRIDLADRRNPDLLVLEGGQGFVPTHTIDEIMARMLRAARRGAAAYLARIGRTDLAPEDIVSGSYDKLHNDAYDGDPDSPAMRDAVAAARCCGMWKDEPIAGWTVSCDARLFAREYPGMPVLTSGAGRLQDAHSDNERIDLGDLFTCVEFLALYILKRTGIIESLD